MIHATEPEQYNVLFTDIDADELHKLADPSLQELFKRANTILDRLPIHLPLADVSLVDFLIIIAQGDRQLVAKRCCYKDMVQYLWSIKSKAKWSNRRYGSLKTNAVILLKPHNGPR